MEEFIPMLATKTKPFDSENYLYEIKWDGIRCISYIENDRYVLKSRNNLDITQKYPEFREMASWFNHKPVVIDGEIIVIHEGRPSFSEWQKRGNVTDIKKIERMAATNPAIYIVFDLLVYDGRDLRNEKLIERKRLLESVVTENQRILISKTVDRYGTDLYKSAVENGLEGVVAKDINSPYIGGKRTRYWYKFKKIIEEDFVICGYIKGSDKEIGSLILGSYSTGKLVYRGTTGTGFTDKMLDYLENLFKPGIQAFSPFGYEIKGLKNHVWLNPKYVCEVEYLEEGSSGLRHSSFKALRDDKDPKECIIESH